MGFVLLALALLGASSDSILHFKAEKEAKSETATTMEAAAQPSSSELNQTEVTILKTDTEKNQPSMPEPVNP